MFLDLLKAFDTLNHDVLLSKLERYSIWGICNDWFHSYLSERSLVAKIYTSDNQIVNSEKFDITYGRAKGSCLGPLLFILFSNDIHLLPTFSNIVLFADDTTLLNSTKHLEFLKFSLEHDMVLLMDWFKANQLLLNVDKTVLLKFWPGKAKFKVEIDGPEIVNLSKTKFLGIVVDKCLNWKEHTNTLYNKMLSNKRLLSNAKNLLPINCLKKIYYEHVYI